MMIFRNSVVIRSTTVSKINTIFSGTSAIFINDVNLKQFEILNCLFAENIDDFGSISISISSGNVHIVDVCGYSSTSKAEGCFINVKSAKEVNADRVASAFCLGENNILKFVSFNQNTNNINVSMCKLTGAYLFIHHPSNSSCATRITLAENNSSMIYGISTSFVTTSTSNYLNIIKNFRTTNNLLLHLNIKQNKYTFDYFVIINNDPDLIYKVDSGIILMKNGWTDIEIPDNFDSEKVKYGVTNTFEVNRWNILFCYFHSFHEKKRQSFHKTKNPGLLSILAFTNLFFFKKN